MDTREAITAAFNAFSDQYEQFGEEWIDMDTAKIFAAGWQAAIAHAVPENCVVVPKYPTEDMVEAGRNTPCIDTGNDEEDAPEDYRIVYRAMIAAAPAQGEKDE